jgi:hypothetical protein
MKQCPKTGRQCELTGCTGDLGCALEYKSTPLPPHQLGWKCPVCGRGNAPWMATCPCNGNKTLGDRLQVENG